MPHSLSTTDGSRDSRGLAHHQSDSATNRHECSYSPRKDLLAGMMNVRKRMWSGRAKLEPKWFISLTPEQQVQQYGRSICFRTVDYSTRKCVFEFYCIPFDFAEQTETPLPTGILPFEKNGDIPHLSAFSSMGTCLFCFGGNKTSVSKPSMESASSAFYRSDSSNGCFYSDSDFNMIHGRRTPEIISIQEKLLVIGGIGHYKKFEDLDSWVEVFDPYSNLFRPESSLPMELRASPGVVTASIPSLNQILVASTFSNSAFVCDVGTLMWKRFDQSKEFVFGIGPRNSQPFCYVRGEAAVVRDTILCWFHFRGNLLYAYDLKLKMWFEKPIKGLKKVGKLIPSVYANDFSLLPLDYDHICLLWFNHLPYAPEPSYRVLHCIKVVVSIDYARQHPIFKSSVISYRSYVLKTWSSYIEAVILEEVEKQKSHEICMKLQEQEKTREEEAKKDLAKDLQMMTMAYSKCTL